MDTLRKLEIQSACEALVARYCHLCDDREHAAFAALFTEDGMWIRPAGEFRGRKAIFDWMETRPVQQVTRHIMGSVHVEVLDEENAAGIGYCTVFQDYDPPAGKPSPLVQPKMVVDYRDRFRRSGGEWLIAERRTRVVFSAEFK